jgi:hypothetical protein
MSFHTPRTDDVEGQSDALGLRSMGISHALIACMRITLKKPRFTAEMPAFVTYRINRFSLSFPKLYRQATNKIAGISDEAAEFLSTYF